MRVQRLREATAAGAADADAMAHPLTGGPAPLLVRGLYCPLLYCPLLYYPLLPLYYTTPYRTMYRTAARYPPERYCTKGTLLPLRCVDSSAPRILPLPLLPTLPLTRCVGYSAPCTSVASCCWGCSSSAACSAGKANYNDEPSYTCSSSTLRKESGRGVLY